MFFTFSLKIATLIFHTLWEVWTARNRLIFENQQPLGVLVIGKILASNCKFWPTKKVPCTARDFFDEGAFAYPLGYFDGAAQGGLCGAGMVLKLIADHEYHRMFLAGVGTNTRAELLALWGLLSFARNLNIEQLFSLGDSSYIIEWANEHSRIHSLHLHH